MTGTTALGGEPAAVADRVLDLAAAVPGADAEVTVLAGTSALTRFADSYVHQNVVEQDVEVRLRVAVDGRWAASVTNRADTGALHRLVQSTVDAARLRPVDPGYPGLAAPEPVRTPGNWDEPTALATPNQRAAVVGAFVATAGGLTAAGYVSTASEQAAYANTAGQRVTGSRTAATLDGIARTSTSDGVARWTSVRLADLSGAESGAAAAVAARSAAEPTDLEPGDYEVVLEPSCVANVLQFLGQYGFNGRTVAEGRSFVQVGSRQFDPAIELWDDATDTLSTSLPYDGEGTVRRRVDLVSAGITSGVLHDRRTAANAGTTSTGHGLPGAELWGPMPTDLRLGLGTGGSAAELARRMRRGLLVSDFWYTRILDPRTTVVTGLTRNGVWLVENGTVVRPVRNLRFTQSYLDALAPDEVLGIGSVPGALSDRWSGGLSVVPSLHLARWHFTGGAGG